MVGGVRDGQVALGVQPVGDIGLDGEGVALLAMRQAAQGYLAQFTVRGTAPSGTVVATVARASGRGIVGVTATTMKTTRITTTIMTTTIVAAMRATMDVTTLAATDRDAPI